MVFSLLGYFFCMITVLTTVVVLLTGFSNISTFGNGRHYSRPVIARTVTVETQRHSRVAKEASPAKDVSPPVVTTAKADAKKIKHYKPKVLARQQNNYGYGNALDYAEESGYGPRGLFFR
jgi:phage tail tape-measure protein